MARFNGESLSRTDRRKGILESGKSTPRVAGQDSESHRRVTMTRMKVLDVIEVEISDIPEAIKFLKLFLKHHGVSVMASEFEKFERALKKKSRNDNKVRELAEIIIACAGVAQSPALPNTSDEDHPHEGEKKI